MRYSLLTSRTILKQAGLLFFCLFVPAQAAPASVLKMIVPVLSTMEKQQAGPHWRTPQLVPTNTGSLWDPPKLAIDGEGRVMAVWSQHDGDTYSIFMNRYVPGIGWGTTELVETNSNTAWYPQIAMDAAGNAWVVWSQHDNSGASTIWANQYVVGTGWGTAQCIGTDNYNSTRFVGVPDLVIDIAGNVLVVWDQYENNRLDILANRYSVGSGWGTPQLIETDNAGNALYPQVGVDSNGNALAVWEQNDGTRGNIVANRYAPGIGWGTAQLIEANDSGDAYSPDVVMDAAGNALAVWTQSDGTSAHTWANRYATNWGTAELIGTNNGGTIFASELMGDPVPRIAIDMNASGNAFAVWTKKEEESCGPFTTQANRYVAGTGWNAAERIGEKVLPEGEGCALWSPDMAVGMDASGNALAVWSQLDLPLTPDFRRDIKANRYVAGKGWGTAQLLETNTTKSAYHPQIVVDSAGNALAVWAQEGQKGFEIWSACFE